MLKIKIEDAVLMASNNYRTDYGNLEAFAERLLHEGQQQPGIIAIFPDGRKVLASGHRRLKALEMIGATHFLAIEKNVSSMSDFLKLQFLENKDRKDSGPIEDSRAILAMQREGMTKLQIIQLINFPTYVKSKEEKVDYINRLIDLTLLLSPKMQEAISKGLLKIRKTHSQSKPDFQALLLKRYPAKIQDAFAQFILEKGKAVNDDDIEKFAKGFAFNLKNANFDPEDETLPGGKCSACPFYAEVSVDFMGTQEKVPTCYQTSCASEKTAANFHIAEGIAEATGSPWVYAGEKDVEKWSLENRPDRYPTEYNGRTVVYNWVESEETKSIHSVLAVGMQNTMQQGKVFWICPVASKCPVHFPEISKEKEAKQQTIHQNKIVQVDMNVAERVVLDYLKAIVKSPSVCNAQQQYAAYMLYRHGFTKHICEVLGVEYNRDTTWDDKLFYKDIMPLTDDIQLAYFGYYLDRLFNKRHKEELIRELGPEYLDKYNSMVADELSKIKASVEKKQTIAVEKSNKELNAMFAYAVQMPVSYRDKPDWKVVFRKMGIKYTEGLNSVEYKRIADAMYHTLSMKHPEYAQQLDGVVDRIIEPHDNRIANELLDLGYNEAYHLINGGYSIGEDSYEVDRVIFIENRLFEKARTQIKQYGETVGEKATWNDDFSIVTFGKTVASTGIDLTDVDSIIQHATVEGNLVRITSEKVERKVYEEVKKKLEGIGGKWKGGKIAGFVFEGWDPATLLERIQQGEKINIKKDFQYYPTPAIVAQRMIDKVEWRDEMLVLEPSAGQGNILQWIPDGMHCFAYELMPENEAILKKYFPEMNFLGNDFLEDDNYEFFDVILMNPPFANGQDTLHITEAYERLKPGGTLVAIASNSWTYHSGAKYKLFKQWVEEEGDYETLPAGTFKESGTNVISTLITFQKPLEDEYLNDDNEAEVEANIDFN